MGYPTQPDPLAEGEGFLDPEPAPPPLRPPDAPILGPVPSGGRPEPVEGEDAPKFRRPARPAPAPGDARPVGGEDPFAEPTDVALAAPGAAGARAIAEPLAALAAAFQANAEALRRSQEVQADLGRALQRADRSEVLLQSTGALNDTFKGLTTVQRTLLQRIDSATKEARSGRWFLPVLVLAAVAVVGAGLWLVVHRMQEMERDVVGNGDVATQIGASFDRGREQGARDAASVASPELESLKDRIRHLEADLKAAQDDRDAKAAALATAQNDMAGLRGEVLSGRNDALRLKAVEEELNRLRAEAAVRDPEAERAKRDLAEEKRVNADLRQKLATLGMGKMAAATEEAAAAPTPDAGPAPEAATPRGIDRARDRMNELLMAGGANRTDYLQIVKLGGAQSTRLTEVVATRYGANGRVINFIRAKDLRVVVDRLNRTVELVFTDGSIDTNGSSIPFPGGTFSKVVAEGDLVSQWTNSGLTFVTSK